VLHLQSEDEVSLLLCIKDDHGDSIPAARRHGRGGVGRLDWNQRGVGGGRAGEFVLGHRSNIRIV
jgi:hypothetical protein